MAPSRLLRRCAVLGCAAALLYAAYLAVRFHHVENRLYLWLDGSGRQAALWNREPAGASLDLAAYRAGIDGKAVAGVSRNLSGLTYDTDRGRLLAVVNRPPTLIELDGEGTPLASYPLRNVSDVEGVAYLGDGEVAIVEEGRGTVRTFALPARPQPIDAAAGRRIDVLRDGGNHGLEGVGYDRGNDLLYMVRERKPRALYRIAGLKTGKDAQPRIEDLSAWIDRSVFGTDLSSVDVDPETGHLLLLSDESQLVMEMDPTGLPLGLRHLDGVPQAEGVAVDPGGRLFVVSEPDLFYRFDPAPPQAAGGCPGVIRVAAHPRLGPGRPGC
ncbi:SdiA-regulated domain-containing protein [Pigmentiphaga soli]|uniref:SdiA-regulated domain-containing protein n=1 Tax=Pigmentiphaga soli TaxID=1007095 RepID=A0ABP8GHD9_9BURK